MNATLTVETLEARASKARNKIKKITQCLNYEALKKRKPEILNNKVVAVEALKARAKNPEN